MKSNCVIFHRNLKFSMDGEGYQNVRARETFLLQLIFSYREHHQLVSLPSRAFCLLLDAVDATLYNWHRCTASATTLQQVSSFCLLNCSSHTGLGLLRCLQAPLSSSSKLLYFWFLTTVKMKNKHLLCPIPLP